MPAAAAPSHRATCRRRRGEPLARGVRRGRRRRPVPYVHGTVRQLTPYKLYKVFMRGFVYSCTHGITELRDMQL